MTEVPNNSPGTSWAFRVITILDTYFELKSRARRSALPGAMAVKFDRRDLVTDRPSRLLAALAYAA